jgi:hypothetical protein
MAFLYKSWVNLQSEFYIKVNQNTFYKKVYKNKIRALCFINKYKIGNSQWVLLM